MVFISVQGHMCTPHAMHVVLCTVGCRYRVAIIFLFWECFWTRTEPASHLLFLCTGEFFFSCFFLRIPFEVLAPSFLLFREYRDRKAYLPLIAGVGRRFIFFFCCYGQSWGCCLLVNEPIKKKGGEVYAWPRAKRT